MKAIYLSALLLFMTIKQAPAQSTNCGDAVLQLQNYAAQVNQLYNNEYWTVIPGARCPAYDQWGRPFNLVVVQNCRLQMLGYLNNWYGQQCAYVNNWYAQIVRGCSDQQPSTTVKPAPRKITGSEENEQIDTDEIEELTAGIDEEKAVKIKIPKTAAGFKPR